MKPVAAILLLPILSARAAEIPDEGVAIGILPDQLREEIPMPGAPSPSAAGFASGGASTAERQVDGVPSSGNHILVEEDFDLGWTGGTTVGITSDVPVTIQRYTDGGRFLMGQQPVPENMMKVLVTSDCATDETPNPFEPTVGVSSNGDISVTVGATEEEAAEMTFLEPSSYTAFWTWVNEFCGFPGDPGVVPTEPVVVVGPIEGGCEAGPDADPDESCGDGEFCQLPPGACAVETLMPLPVIWYGTCERIPDMCIEIYMPVCGCDGVTYANDCKANGAGTNVAYEGECRKIEVIDVNDIPCEIEGHCRDPNGVCMGEVVCFADPCQVNPPCPEGEECSANYCGGCHSVCTPAVEASDSAACQIGSAVLETKVCASVDEFCLLDPGVCNNKSGVHEGFCATKPMACTFDFNPVCGCDEVTYPNECAARSNGTSVSRPGECDAATNTTTLPTLADISPSGPADSGAACDQGVPCSEAGSTCTSGSETCCGNTSPSFQCTCQDMGDGTLRYDFCLFTDACMMPPCCASGPPAGLPPPSDGTCTQMGQLCDTGIEDDYCCFDMMGGSGSYCTQSGGKPAMQSSSPTAAPTNDPLASSSPTTTPTNDPLASFSPTTTPTNDPLGLPEGDTTTVASTTTGATASTAGTTGTTASTTTTTSDEASTTVGSTSATSTSSSATTAATEGIVPIEGDFPTQAPFTKSPTTAPVAWWSLNPDGATSPNSAFHRPLSFSFCVAVTLLAMVACSILLPGNGANAHWGFGALFVAALAVSAIRQKSSSSSPGNTRRTRSLSNKKERATQNDVCTFNVEILLDGCSHALEISAPSGRIVDAVVDHTSQERPGDSCTIEYAANITFPLTENTEQVPANGSVPALPSWGPECLRAVIGRPFIDATGGSLLAMPLVHSIDAESDMNSASSWSGEAMLEVQSSAADCVANNQSQFLLGEDWTQRALGEHASVASFSAFSIALMTNQAPSDLVEAALNAARDEIRHAKVSFRIAAQLLNRKAVGPGPLPESKLGFRQDLEALALAVAREGCVDETLSAFAAAVEAEHISQVLDMGIEDSPYSSVDAELLQLIRKELVTIANDESNHSALAWRTLNWVCRIDPSACDYVHRNVFHDRTVDLRLNQRADASFSERSSTLQLMSAEWKKIFDAHLLARDEEHITGSLCEDVVGNHSGAELVASVTENIRRQVLCV